MEGLRYPEIASTLGISASAVGEFLRRALLRLKKVRDEYLFQRHPEQELSRIWTASFPPAKPGNWNATLNIAGNAARN